MLFIAAFPFLLRLLVVGSGCAGVGGACGALAVVLGIYLRYPVVIGVGLYLAILTWRRLRTVGVHPSAFLFVLLIFTAASPFLFALGNFWGASFALGIVSLHSPLPTLVLLLASLIALSRLPEDDAGHYRGPARGTALAIGGLVLLLTSPQWLMGFMMIPFVGRLFLPAAFLISGRILGGWGPYAVLISAAAFVVALELWIIEARRGAGTIQRE
ncbi:MAG: hypothetical protein WC729_26920 [Sphingomonas sp.]|uniref:hypothetical protein n=1 Tax=Sphingomonas sp. TaxID=28214 RepID=UPI003568B5E4